MKLLLLFYFLFIVINGDDCSVKKPNDLNINPCGYDCILDSSGKCEETCTFSNLYYIENGICVLLKNCKDRQVDYISKWPCGENCWLDLKDGLCKEPSVSHIVEDNENVGVYVPNKHRFYLLSTRVNPWFLYMFISCGLLFTVLIFVGGIFCCKKTKHRHRKSENTKDKGENGENAGKKRHKNCLVSKDGFEIESKLQLSEVQKNKLLFHGFTNILNVMMGV
jgi:hypothetical protein